MAALLLLALGLEGCGNKQPAAAQAGGSQQGTATQAGSPGSAAQTGGTQGNGAAGGRRAAVVPVQAAAVHLGLLSADRDTAGVVTPTISSQVAAQVAGVVLRLARLPGDWVKTGEVVIQLDDSQLKLSLANAQAALENAKINLAIGQDNVDTANPKLAFQVQSAQSALSSAQKTYDSQKALYALGGISASQLDSASSNLSQAQANLEAAKSALTQNQKSGDQTIAQLRLQVTQATNQLQQAQLSLQYASIRAPFGGQISAINVQPGMYVSLNTPAFTLVSEAKQVSFSVSPSDAPAMPLGSVLSYEFGGKSYPVKVSQSPSAPINGVVPMVAVPTASFPLPFGTVGNVSYLVGLARGALVPIASLDSLENQNFVYTIVNNRAQPRNVTIINESGITAAVSGLEEGAVVVISPPPGLLPGSQVQVVASGPAMQGNGGGAQGGQAPGGQVQGPGGQGQSPAPGAGAGGQSPGAQRGTGSYRGSGQPGQATPQAGGSQAPAQPNGAQRGKRAAGPAAQGGGTQAPGTIPVPAQGGSDGSQTPQAGKQ